MMTILDMIYYSLQNKLSFYFTLKFIAKIIVSVQEMHFYCFKCFLLCFDTLICILSWVFFFFFFFLQKCVFKIISNYRILILFNSSILPLVVMYTTFNEVSGERRNPIYAIECVYISIKRPKMSVMAKIWT